MKKLIVLSSLLFILSGCAINVDTKGGGGNDGGLYRSENKGDTWLQKVLMPTTSGKPKSIGAIDVVSLAMDPSDTKAIYLGSAENGLFYSYNKSDDWQLSASLGRVTVNSIAVDPASKCIVYVATGNKVFKSTDCSRTWSQVYYDNNLNVQIKAIAIDNYNSNIVYIGTSRGEVIKSLDKGNSWQTSGRFEDDIEKIVIRKENTKILFAATGKSGIFRSTDGGANWTDLSENLKDFKDAPRFRDLVASESEPGLIMLATHYGLLKSADNGNTWSKIELITPEKDAIINSVAMSPKDAKEIYYVTYTTFYRSLDGGQNWTTKALPSSRAGWELLIDPENPKTIYLGVRSLK